MGEVIGLVSGAGGTGKTACTAGIALALAKSGKTVLCIDCCEGLGNLDIYLAVESQDALSYADICRGHYTLAQAAVHPTERNLRYLTAPVHAAGVDRRAFLALLATARREFDYVLLDAPGGLGEMALLAADGADRCVVLCGIDPASVRAAGRMADALQLQKKTDVRMLVTRVHSGRLRAMRKTVDDLMDSVGLPLLGLVPEDEQVLLLSGTERFPTGRQGAFAAYGRIAKRLQGMPVPVPTR